MKRGIFGILQHGFILLYLFTILMSSMEMTRISHSTCTGYYIHGIL